MTEYERTYGPYVELNGQQYTIGDLRIDFQDEHGRWHFLVPQNQNHLEANLTMLEKHKASYTAYRKEWVKVEL